MERVDSLTKTLEFHLRGSWRKGGSLNNYFSRPLCPGRSLNRISQACHGQKTRHLVSVERLVQI